MERSKSQLHCWNSGLVYGPETDRRCGLLLLQLEEWNHSFVSSASIDSIRMKIRAFPMMQVARQRQFDLRTTMLSEKLILRVIEHVPRYAEALFFW